MQHMNGLIRATDGHIYFNGEDKMCIRDRLVPVVLTAAIPFVWIIAVQHHSALHARFTFRILSVAAAAADVYKRQQQWQSVLADRAT